MVKENVFVVGFLCSLEWRIGWAFWSLWKAFWRSEVSGSFDS